MIRKFRQLRHDEEGSSLILTIFYGVFALVLILIVVAATSLTIDRKRLFSLADGAALAGAESFELSATTIDEEGLTATLSSEGVRSAAVDHLAAVPHGTLEDLVLENAATSDGLSSVVTVSAWWRPPVLTIFVPEGLRLEVTSTSRSVMR